LQPSARKKVRPHWSVFHFSELVCFISNANDFFGYLSLMYSGQTNKIVVILALEPVSTPLSGTLGSPVDIGGSGAVAVPSAPPAAAPQDGGASMLGISPMAPNSAMTSQIDPTTGRTLTPIKLLDMYLTRWSIRARCASKTERKDFGQNGGRLFSVTLLDESGEIRATMFNDSCDKWLPVFNVGGMYVISQGKLKFANKTYTSVKHAYELTLHADSVVEPVASVASVPHMHFDFVDIGNLVENKKDDMVDLIGVVIHAKPWTTIATKNGDTKKRAITLADTSARTVELTLWGDQAESFDDVLQSHGENLVLAVKGLRVSDFGGRSLSALQSSEFEVNPDIPACANLKNWFATVPNGGRDLPSVSSGGGGGGGGGAGGSSKAEKTLSSIVNENLGLQANADYITVPGVVVTQFKRGETFCYQACKIPECKGRKVLPSGGNLECPTCHSVNNFRLRWVLNFTAFDHTGKEFISGFGEAGSVLLGCEAEVMADLKDKSDDLGVAKIYEEGRFKAYNMRLSVKNELYKDMPRTKVSLQSVTPIDYVADSERLLSRIAELQRK
jgi:replication factor A1